MVRLLDCDMMREIENFPKPVLLPYVMKRASATNCDDVMNNIIPAPKFGHLSRDLLALSGKI